MANNKIIDLERLSRFKDKLDDVLDTKANVDGNYPTMTVGSADSLTPYGENSGASDTTPFVMQSTGGSSDVGSKAYLRELRGNSVAFNQEINHGQSTSTSNYVTFTNNNDGSWTANGTATGGNAIKNVTSIHPQFIAGHKYLVKGCPAGGSNTTYELQLGGGTIDIREYGSGTIYTATSTNTTSVWAYLLVREGVTANNLKFVPQLFDLTQMFGAGNEPTSVLEFNRLFPKSYYEYNAGTLLSCKVNGIKNVGYNAFDGELELGILDFSTGATITNSTYVRSKNFTKVIPGQTYTIELEETNKWGALFCYDENYNAINITNAAVIYKSINSGLLQLQLPDNACYVKFIHETTNTNENVTIHLTWDGSRVGYEEHKEWQYNLPNVELRSAGDVYDELLPDGTLIRRVGVVDLGTLTWSASGLSTETNHIWYVNNFDGKIRTPNLLSVKYAYVEEGLYATTPNTVCVIGDSSLRINTGSSSGTPTGLLYYELATPTTEQTSNTFQEIQDIDDFGTQEFLYDSDIAIPVPQCNEFFYPVDYKAFIDSLGGRDDIQYDANEIVSHSELSAYDVIDAQLKDAIGGTLRNVVAFKGNIDFANTDFVDLGTLTWTYESANARFYASLVPYPKEIQTTDLPNALCSKYKVIKYNDNAGSLQQTLFILSNSSQHRVYVRDNTYTDATTFKNAMKGVLLAYEKA